VQDATEFGRFFAFAYFLRIASLDVDAQLFLQDVNLLVQRQLLPTEYPGASEGGTANHDGINPQAKANSQKPIFFTLDGRRADSSTRGLLIVRNADGTTHKVIR